MKWRGVALLAAMVLLLPACGQKVRYQGVSERPVPPVNRAPTLDCTAESTTLRTGESVRLTAEASDPDGDDVTVSWTAEAGTLTEETGTRVNWSSEGVDPGTVQVSATAEDSFGGTADCSLALRVEEPPPPPQPTVLDFSFDEYPSGGTRLDNRMKAVLDDVALQLREHPRAAAVVTGHTDATGPDDLNMKTARKRAERAVAYLVETHGIDASRITVASAGSGDPAASNDTREGRARNRRVTIVVTIPPQ